MPVKIRLTRMGKKKQPTYRVVVADSRAPRDGAYIDLIGRYDPRQDPSVVEIDNDKALDWLQKGAQPTDRARKLLEISGAWARFRVAKGDIHTVAEAPPSPPPPPPPPPVPAEPVAAAHEPEIHVVGDHEAGEAPEEVAAADAEVEDATVEDATVEVEDATAGDSATDAAGDGGGEEETR